MREAKLGHPVCGGGASYCQRLAVDNCKAIRSNVRTCVENLLTVVLVGRGVVACMIEVKKQGCHSLEVEWHHGQE